MKRDIVTLGEILIDFTPVKNDDNKIRFEQNAGGAPANVMAAITKLGLKTGFIGCVGDDQFGHFLADFLKDNHIDSKDLKISNEYNTTLAFVHLKEDGDREFSFYRNPGADQMICEEDISEDMFEDVKVFHFGSLSLTDEPARGATLKAIQISKDKGCIISYDPNLRPPLWKSLDEAKEQMLSVMEYVDILKISEEELYFLTGIEDIEEGSKYLYEKYKTPLIIATLGPDGCAIRKGDMYDVASGVKVKAVDTTGAGDSHLGAMLYQIIMENSKLEDIPFNKILDFGKFANHMAAYVTTKYGSAEIMPSYEQVKSAMANYPQA